MSKPLYDLTTPAGRNAAYLAGVLTEKGEVPHPGKGEYTTSGRRIMGYTTTGNGLPCKLGTKGDIKNTGILRQGCDERNTDPDRMAGLKVVREVTYALGAFPLRGSVNPPAASLMDPDLYSAAVDLYEAERVRGTRHPNYFEAADEYTRRLTRIKNKRRHGLSTQDHLITKGK